MLAKVCVLAVRQQR